ncbi:MAG: tRNA (adenosine(37)-N6)-threonylcarbamoyltransferase complex dimerization subunit type 1 TsaB [Methylophilaceae bacterium]
MKILSIDTCTENISIALTIDELVVEKDFPSGKDYSEDILPQINKLLSENDLKITDIDAISFGAGPGSFTGIRIACGIAYGIAYANNLPIIGINNLEALAFLSMHENSISCIDARMGQVYIGIYQNKNNTITSLIEPGLYNPSNLPKLPNIDKAMVIGSGLNNYKEEFELQYENIELDYYVHKCLLARPIGILSRNQFDKKFHLKNANPIYIRNKVAQTTQERLQQK